MQDQIRALEEQKRNSDVEVQRVKNERDDLEIQIKKVRLNSAMCKSIRV